MNATEPKLEAELEAIASPESSVQIWMANLDAILPNELDELRMSLNGEERARAAQFHFERDRRRFVAARAILRQLLGAALDVPAAQIAFEYGPHGKPAITAKTLRFNISHTAGLAMFALARDREVGFDLEAGSHLADGREKLFQLAERILSRRELTVWRSLPDDDARRKVFLRAWTRKEAFIKGIGEGLFHGLQNIEVVLDALNPEASLSIRDWTLHDIPAPPGFAAAMAVERQSRERA